MKIAQNGAQNAENEEKSSADRLPSASHNKLKSSRNSKMHKSRSTCVANMIAKGDDNENSNNDEQAVKMTPHKRKIKIIQNSKTKGTKIKNSHMVILKSIKQKLDLQGMLKDEQ